MSRIHRVEVFLLFVSLAAPALAVERYWIDPGGGPFTDTGNWSAIAGGVGGASVPGSGDLAIYRIDPTYTVGFPGREILDPPLTYQTGFVLVDAGVVTFVDTGGLDEIPGAINATQLVVTLSGGVPHPTSLTTTLSSFTSGSASIAENTTSNSTLNVNGGTLTLTGVAGDDLRIATVTSATGALNINNGADVVVNNGAASPSVIVGRGSSTSTQGTISVSGAGSTLAINNFGTIIFGDNTTPGAAGNAGTGKLNILAGGSVSVSGASLANSPGATGNATVDGDGSTWNVMNELTIGNQGTGTLNVTAKGLVAGYQARLGGFTGSSGTAIVDGTGSQVNITDTLEIGKSGQGSLTVRNGGALASVNAYLGRFGTGIGTATIDGLGATGTWNNTGLLTVGGAHQGTLNILHGGLLTSHGATLASSAGSTGTATVDGIGSTWTSNAQLFVGFDGAATLNVIGGGHLISPTSSVGQNPAGTGLVTIDGATSEWSINGDLFLNVNGTGASTLKLANGGKLSATGQVDVGAHGVVMGRGTVTGAVINGGLVTPGASAGTLHVIGNYTQTAAGILAIELGGTTPDTSYDQLQVTGAVALNGTLQTTLINGFIPAAGNTFNILDGAISGTFSTLSLPALGAGLVWNLSNLYTTGVLSVGVPGDYNNNGEVDAADYVLWRNGGPLANEVDNPGTVNAQDYTAWRARFGNAAGSGSGAVVTSVPEPVSWILFCFAVCSSSFTRRTKKIGTPLVFAVGGSGT